MRELIQEEKELLLRCPLFKGMTDESLRHALSFYHAEIKHFEKGEFIKKSTDRINFFGFVLSGIIQVCMDEVDGSHMVMATVEKGKTFGESLCFLKKDSPVYICAAVGSDVLCLKSDNLKNADGAEEKDLLLRFTSMLAERTLMMNDRIQILSKFSIREKLMTMFSEYPGAASGKTFEIPLSREDMAAYLGTDRSALSRELSKMKKEGIIDYYRNSFRITG